jgi:hypothetical protein
MLTFCIYERGKALRWGLSCLSCRPRTQQLPPHPRPLTLGMPCNRAFNLKPKPKKVLGCVRSLGSIFVLELFDSTSNLQPWLDLG